jgi:hypothetical protein
MHPSAHQSRWFVRAPRPIAIAVVFISLVAWTWQTWPDVLVDFGREFYVPMRLGEGAVLYRDLAYFNGPLSPYFNALCFRLFGASLHTLFLVNIALLGLLVTLLYRLLARIGDSFSSFLAMLLLLPVFGIAQLTGFGNYNFIAPYSHELTHGVTLGVATVAALARWGDAGKDRWLVAAGACVGMALLTKPETAAAALFAGTAAFICHLRAAPRERRAGRPLRFFAASILAPPLLAVALLALHMPMADALEAIAKPWSEIGAGKTTSLAFYRAGMGLDEPALNFLAMFAWAGYWLLAFVPAAFVAWRLRIEGRRATALACAAFVLYALALLLCRNRIDWVSLARPLPIFAGIVFAFAVMQVRHGQDVARFASASGLAMLALVLLGKMLFNARIYHYGFALAMPAMVLVVGALGSWLPAALDHRGRAGPILRGALFAVVAVVGLVHLQSTGSYRAEKTVAVGRAGNAFKADIRGNYINSAVAQLAATPPGSTVAVMPEGVMLNVLAHRRTSLRFVTFMPPEVLLFGEGEMLADLVAHPPDRIVLVHKTTSEYGVPYFGHDYGNRLMAWIRGNYRAEALIGDMPLQPGSDFGLLILVRDSPTTH